VLEFLIGLSMFYTTHTTKIIFILGMDCNIICLCVGGISSMS